MHSVLHPNMVKDLNIAIEGCRAALPDPRDNPDYDSTMDDIQGEMDRDRE